jgi:hypothetical protein
MAKRKAKAKTKAKKAPCCMCGYKPARTERLYDCVNCARSACNLCVTGSPHRKAPGVVCHDCMPVEGPFRVHQRNPMLAIVGNPGKKRRKKKNPTATTGRMDRLKGETTVEEIRHLPGFKKALKKHFEFHDEQPDGVLVIDVGGPPGRKVVTGLGEVPSTHYTVPWKSQKNRGDQFGNEREEPLPPDQSVLWEHEHLTNAPPIEVWDPETGLTMKVPTSKKTRVTDYWYD